MSSYWPSPFLVAHTIAKAWATFSHAYLGLISVQSPPTVHCDPTVEHVDRKSKTPIHSCSSRTLATSHFTRPKTRERERESVCAGAPVAPPVSPFVGARAHLRLSALPSSGPAAAPLAAQGPPR
jgi:hypothetical protein